LLSRDGAGLACGFGRWADAIIGVFWGGFTLDLATLAGKMGAGLGIFTFLPGAVAVAALGVLDGGTGVGFGMLGSGTGVTTLATLGGAACICRETVGAGTGVGVGRRLNCAGLGAIFLACARTAGRGTGVLAGVYADRV
jgi:hypothetical protein